MGAMRNAYNIFFRKLEGKTSLGRYRYSSRRGGQVMQHAWGKGNIKIYFSETHWKGVDWIHLPQDRDLWWALVNMVMNLWFP
jgi:hypothetical protein